MKKIRLEVLGISYGHSEANSYILLLGENQSNRKLPIVIAPTETQAIAVLLEGISIPRPLTHDLFLKFSEEFGVELVEVNITKIENGVFYAELLLFDGDRYVSLDARPSDAVALALRFRCPIFTNSYVLDEASVVLDEDDDLMDEVPLTDTKDLKNYTIDELQTMLNAAIESEEYELASLLRDELNSRNS